MCLASRHNELASDEPASFLKQRHKSWEWASYVSSREGCQFEMAAAVGGGKEGEEGREGIACFALLPNDDCWERQSRSGRGERSI